MQENNKTTHIVIVGGGLSGIMAATRLTHDFIEQYRSGSKKSLKITVIDPMESLGGNTYNRNDVNVYMAQPIKDLGMDDADGLVKHMNRVLVGWRSPADWMEIAPQVPYDNEINSRTGRTRGFDPEAYITHNQYGFYVRNHLNALRLWLEKENYPVSIYSDSSVGRPTRDYLKAEVLDAWEENGKGHLKLDDGCELEADAIILATGNVAPKKLYDMEGNCLVGAKGYYNLDDDGLTRKNVNEAKTTAFIGMANGAHFAMLSAIKNGYTGKFILCSGDGRTPEIKDFKKQRNYTRSYLTVRGCQDLVKRKHKLTAEDWWQLLKKEFHFAKVKGFSRYDVVDSLLPDMNAMWRMMDEEQREAFWKTHGTEWGQIRYRIPGVHVKEIMELFAEGRVEYRDGLIRDGHKSGIHQDKDGGFTLTFKNPDGTTENIHVEKIINNTGPSTRLSDMSSFIQKLQGKGIVQQHPMGGLRVDDGLRIQSREGHNGNIFYAIGPITSGEFIESITIPAIRQCAHILSDTVLKDHALGQELENTPKEYHKAVGDQVAYWTRQPRGQDGGAGFRER